MEEAGGGSGHLRKHPHEERQGASHRRGRQGPCRADGHSVRTHSQKCAVRQLHVLHRHAVAHRGPGDRQHGGQWADGHPGRPVHPPHREPTVWLQCPVPADDAHADAGRHDSGEQPPDEGGAGARGCGDPGDRRAAGQSVPGGRDVHRVSELREGVVANRGRQAPQRGGQHQHEEHGVPVPLCEVRTGGGVSLHWRQAGRHHGRRRLRHAGPGAVRGPGAGG
mmetsp:Transcript_6004/g.10871  ORF Transcript_6004/g.10871 Transcript_6004/m.10871 type:complete len:222 (-) Transcript_6004:186-851(-)